MIATHPGESVLGLLRDAANRVVVVAPYIKASTLRQLLGAIPSSVSECICVTRWLPEDIAAGVCDLDIFDDLEQVPGGYLLVHPHLHAKYYSNGQQTLVGSANLTSRALGWHPTPNIELLVSLPSTVPGLADWEKALLNSAIRATPQLRDQIKKQADELGRDQVFQHAPEVEVSIGEGAVYWVPQCPVPERLWEVYLGRGTGTMVSSALEAAQEDLTVLAPPKGLDQSLFTAYVSGILKQMPLLTEIDKLASAGLTDAKASEFLADRLSAESPRDYDQIWRVIKDWLVHFLPDTYIREAGQETLVKGRRL